MHGSADPAHFCQGVRDVLGPTHFIRSWGATLKLDLCANAHITIPYQETMNILLGLPLLEL